MFFSAILQLSRNPFTYDGGESGPENDAPRCRGVATEASQVSLGHETGVANKTPVGDTYIVHRATHWCCTRVQMNVSSL